jgi:carbamoyl-phosphate synthase large subunit
VPFVSKATGVPIAKLAARVMTGEKLADMDITEQVPEKISVKEVVLPFDRLPGSDPRLGPEMKSTGEVMGTAATFGRAYDKAQSSTNKPIPRSGTAIVDFDVEGFGEFFEVTDFEDRVQAIQEGRVDLIVSRDRNALEAAVEEEITYFSTVPSAKAALEAIRAKDEPLDVQSVSDRPRMQEWWGKPKQDERTAEQASD